MVHVNSKDSTLTCFGRKCAVLREHICQGWSATDGEIIFRRFHSTKYIYCSLCNKLWNFVNIISPSVAVFNLGVCTPWGWYTFTETYWSSAYTVHMYFILCIWLVEWFKSHMPDFRFNTERFILSNSTEVYISKCSLQLQGEILNKV